MPEALGLGEGHQHVGWSPMSAEVVLVRVSAPVADQVLDIFD